MILDDAIRATVGKFTEFTVGTFQRRGVVRAVDSRWILDGWIVTLDDGKWFTVGRLDELEVLTPAVLAERERCTAAIMRGMPPTELT
jgi:hypothetical protein